MNEDLGLKKGGEIENQPVKNSATIAVETKASDQLQYTSCL